MTEAEYNNAEGIRRSDLWRMEDSAEKFKWFMEHPIERTPAMAFGAACHKWILEPTDWESEYVVAPAVDRRTKAGKEEWEKFLESSAGKEVIAQDDFNIMNEMSNVLMSNDLASALLFGKRQVEVPIFWRDPDTNERCKAKLDVMRQADGRYVIVDYKTTMSASTGRFNSEIFQRGYHMQAGMYSEGLMRSAELDYLPTFVFVAQEKKPPYSVNVISVSEDVMLVGVSKFHDLLEKYHECKIVDIWDGYVSDTPNETTLPGWYSLDEFEE